MSLENSNFLPIDWTTFRSLKNFLSPKVHDLIFPKTDSVTCFNHFFDQNFRLKRLKLEALLRNLQENEQDETYFQMLIEKVFPLINCLEAELRKPVRLDVLLNQVQDDGNELLWMKSNPEMVIDACKMILKPSNDFDLMVGLLSLCSMTEHCLGNLILLKSDYIPPLLKQVLSTNELADIISPSLVKLLQTIIGPPYGVNLRNLLWHGFITISEIRPLAKFGYFLISILSTIGEVLRSKFRLEDIRDRPFREFSTQNSRVIGYFPPLNGCPIETIKTLLSDCGCIHPQMFPLWCHSIDLFWSGKYGYALLMILPLFESSLRSIFTLLNKCDQRLFTAQCRELYTTFGEILSDKITSLEGECENQFISLVPKTIVELLMDLIILPEGWRIRDRLSHGQVLVTNDPEKSERDGKSISFNTCNFITCSVISIVILLSHSFSSSVVIPSFQIQRMHNSITQYLDCSSENGCPPKSSHDLPPSLNYDLILTITAKTFQYRSMFHPNAKLRQQILTCIQDWQLLIPAIDVDSNHFSASKNMIFSIFSQFGLEKKENFDDLCLTQLVSVLENVEIETLFRPRKEKEIVTLFRHSMDRVQQTCKIIQSTIKSRKEQLQKRELRSRQRANLERLVQVVSDIAITLLLTILIESYFLTHLDCIQIFFADNAKCLKSLKKCLKFQQNLTSLSMENRWDKIEWIVCQLLNHSSLIWERSKKFVV